jgi:hypothetical protein
MKKADNFDASKWLVENKITTQSKLDEEKNQFNGKNLDVYKENFKLLGTKETLKTIVYKFEFPQEINDKVISDNPDYEELYKKQNSFTVTIPKFEGLYKPYGLFYPQNLALEDYLSKL